MESIEHPWFARYYVRLSPRMDALGAGTHREELLAGLSGRVVEVGPGNGLTFSRYPGTVEEVVAVEPERRLRALASAAARQVSVPVRVVEGVAEALPLDEASCDAGVVSLVLCSVPDQDRALAELWRVIRPGGVLRFYEHVAFRRPGGRRVQRAVDMVWPRLGGGCHVSRDTAAAIERAGFRIEALRRFRFMPSPLMAPAAPHIIGVARRT